MAQGEKAPEQLRPWILRPVVLAVAALLLILVLSQFFGSDRLATATPDAQQCTDMDCLAQAASLCAPATHTLVDTVDAFGLYMSTQQHIAIDPVAGGCRVRFDTVSQEIVIGESFKQLMRANDASEADIADMERQAVEDSAEALALDGECVLGNAALASALQQWDGDALSWSNLLRGQQCSGALFSR